MNNIQKLRIYALLMIAFELEQERNYQKLRQISLPEPIIFQAPKYIEINDTYLVQNYSCNPATRLYKSRFKK